MILWAFPITTTGLGIWQVYRYRWKQALITEAENNLKKEPLKEPTNEPYRRIELKGELEDRQVKINGIENGKRGHYIIQPFVLSGTRILVQRGFVEEGKNINTNSEHGLIMKHEEQGYRPDNTGSEWFWKDVESLSKQFDTKPVIVAMLKEKGHKYGMEPKPSYRNNHMQYIVTWFSISIITALLIKYKRPVKKQFG
eukprot:NODE_132_length_18298_cov_0.443101.p9 type:complete len:197 gc:universal NODE_132_length_18298_cov_0.443101:16956-17546(+)